MSSSGVRRRVWLLLAALVAATTSLWVPVETPAAVAQESFGVSAVHFVVDVSASMRERDINGKVRIDGAKESLTAVLTSLPGAVTVGLRSYPDDNDCAVADGAVAPLRTSREEIGAIIRNLEPQGNTPTAQALRAAATDLASAGFADRAIIVLISDGESNCGEDPCVVAAEISSERGIDVTVNTVGFQIGDAGRNELECIAGATGGTYVDVEDADELGDSLQDLAAASLGLSVDAPDVVIRSVGVGELLGRSPSVRIRATVRNTSQNTAGDVRATITVTSDRRPFILRPVRSIGNLEAGDSRQIDWSFTPPLDFSDVTISMDVEVVALNAPPVGSEVRVELRGSVRLSDAGPLLRDRDHVAIIGDSYSSGEGAGNYLDGTDTAANPCRRSLDTYGRDLWPSTRTILACSGATSSHLYNNQTAAVPSQLEQLAALHRDRPVDLVLMTLGGNDVEFGDLVRSCLLPLERFTCDETRVVQEDTCGQDAGVRLEDEITAELAPNTGCLHDRQSLSERTDALMLELVGNLERAYLTIDAVVNDGILGDEVVPILVLAYPQAVPDSIRFDEVVRSCTARFGLTYSEWRYAVRFVARLNATVETAVRQAREKGAPVVFVNSTKDAFEPSHTICDDDRYVNDLDAWRAAFPALGRLLANNVWPMVGITPVRQTAAERSAQESFHPNANGYRAMTAGLVQFSNTPAALESLPSRRPDPGRLDLAPTSNIALGDTSDAVIVGADERVEFSIAGLQADSAVTLFATSEVSRLGDGYVDAGGVGRVIVSFDRRIEPGAHTLHLTGTGADGERFLRSWPMEIAEPVGGWQHWTPLLIALSIALLFGSLGVTAVVVGVRRRAVRR